MRVKFGMLIAIEGVQQNGEKGLTQINSAKVRKGPLRWFNQRIDFCGHFSAIYKTNTF